MSSSSDSEAQRAHTLLIRICSCLGSGYIGGSVIQGLLERPDASKFEITALVRSPEKAEKLAKFGVKTEVGSLDDAEKIEELVGRADYVFQVVSPSSGSPCAARVSEADGLGGAGGRGSRPWK